MSGGTTGAARPPPVRPTAPAADDVAGLLKLAASHRAAGRLDEAERLCHRALAIDPDSPDALYRLATVSRAKGRHAEAAVLVSRALEGRPDDAWSLVLLAAALRSTERPAEAERALRRALEVEPGRLDALANLGNLLGSLGRHEEAEALVRQALEQDPDAPEALAGLGHALSNLGRFEEADAVLTRLLALQPDRAMAHLTVGLGLLTRGRWAEGFRGYAWRRRLPGRGPRPDAPPLWGGEPLAGRSVWLSPEQGLGDMIQFARLARPVAAAGGRVLLGCPRVMMGLLRSMPGDHELVPGAEPPPGAELSRPLLDLPGLLGLTTDTVPAEVPYLAAEPDRVARWREAACLDHGFRIGVAWQGSGGQQDGRSYPPAVLAPLARLPGVRLVSLQKGAGVELLGQLPLGMTVEQLGPEFDAGPGAFLDAAAVMASLDLVVTPDTSIAHLAGALACPTWVLLRRVPDWRWLLDREDTPWYPTMRLFRQRQPGDWAEVVARMADALAGLLTAGHRPAPDAGG